MFRRVRAVMAVAIFLPALSACALLDRWSQADITPSAPLELSTASAQPSAFAGEGSGPESSAGEGSGPESSAGATVPVAIPDPIHPESHRVGEEVAVPGATVVYLGLARSDSDAIARFRLVNGTLDPDARLLTEGGHVVQLIPRGDLLDSEPFDLGASGPGQTLTLLVREALVVFQAGPLP